MAFPFFSLYTLFSPFLKTPLTFPLLEGLTFITVS